ncbi:hypothetical protein OS175_15180, partial [Marinicella sp. S1101]|uniref:hypothetical protein n=1 Tax=Marinicella marina TaxID=2996016 RepID=UPI002260E9BE
MLNLGIFKTACVLALLTCWSASRAVIWVGGDAQCDYSSIQAALDDVLLGFDNEIRIANNVVGGAYFENLVFNYTLSENIRIIGGHDSCQGSQTPTASVIDGGGNAPVFLIFGGGTESVGITLDSLVLSNGVSNQTGFGGGLTLNSANTDFLLSNLSIINNNAVNGGGLHVFFRENNNVEIKKSSLVNNQASNGGGIYCRGLGGFLSVLEDNSILANRAVSTTTSDGNGGGMYLTNGCRSFLSSGDNIQGSSTGVVSNQASNHGGGIYLNDAFLRLLFTNNDDDSVDVASIKANAADANGNGLGDGGGVYLTGASSQMVVSTALFEGNEAVNGGAVALSDGSSVTAFSNLIYPCLFDGHCVKMSDNVAGEVVTGIGLGQGGAIYASSGASMAVTRALFTGNQADNGVVAAVRGAASVSMSSSNINNNGGINTNELGQYAVFNAIDEFSALNLTHVTVADNVLNPDSSAFLTAVGAFNFVYNSIIMEDVDVMESFDVNGTSVNLEFDCNLVNETDSLSSANGLSFITN